jgi:hypothetical protein
MNCGLRHVGNDVMQISYRHGSICANFSFNFLKKVVRDQRRPTAPLFVVNISPSIWEFMASLRHILPIHNVAINSNNLCVNFRWTFTFVLRSRMTECNSHLAGLWIGTAISNTFHSNKPLLPLSNEHGSQLKDQGRRHYCHNKHEKFPYRPTRDVALISGHAS